MKAIIAFRVAALAASLWIPTALLADCSPSDDRERLSDEAAGIVGRQDLKKVEADAAIDKETSQILLGRLFDLKTGKPLPLPEGLREQYKRDAMLFAQRLRSEAVEAKARSEATLSRIMSCLDHKNDNSSRP